MKLAFLEPAAQALCEPCTKSTEKANSKLRRVLPFIVSPQEYSILFFAVARTVLLRFFETAPTQNLVVSSPSFEENLIFLEVY